MLAVASATRFADDDKLAPGTEFPALGSSFARGSRTSECTVKWHFRSFRAANFSPQRLQPWQNGITWAVTECDSKATLLTGPKPHLHHTRAAFPSAAAFEGTASPEPGSPTVPPETGTSHGALVDEMLGMDMGLLAFSLASTGRSLRGAQPVELRVCDNIGTLDDTALPPLTGFPEAAEPVLARLRPEARFESFELRAVVGDQFAKAAGRCDATLVACFCTEATHPAVVLSPKS